MTQSAVLPDTLRFQHTTLHLIDHAGTHWVRGRELAECLGYGDARSVINLYDRHRDEFSPSMTCCISIIDWRGVQQRGIRIFSPRGAHLLGMLSSAPHAKAFRARMLDALERLEPLPAPVLAPRPGQVEALRQSREISRLQDEVAMLQQILQERPRQISISEMIRAFMQRLIKRGQP